MKTKLSFRELLAVGSMLFGLFFGAGNPIFPASMGQLAGGQVLAAPAGGRGPRGLYGQSREERDGALDVTAGSLDATDGEEELPGLALALALRSYADRLACQRLLELLRERRPQPEKGKK